jgi:hypothetical protein
VTQAATLSRFEANLVTIARFFVHAVSAPQAATALYSKLPRPRCLSRAAVALVQDTLAKGVTRLLARGGWRRERFLRGNQVADGRLWDRSPLRELAVRFSRHTLEMLLWFSAADLQHGKLRRPAPPDAELTAGDRLVCYHAYAALRETEARGSLAGRLGFGNEALCWLSWPEDFAELPAEARPDFGPWFAGSAWALDALQAELARRVVETEERLGKVTEWQAVQRVGRTRDRVHGAYLTAAESAERRDLARFLMVAVAELLPARPTLLQWHAGLTNLGPRLADRAATQRAAIVLPRQLERLAGWASQARGIGYFDEGYAASQLWKADWEHWHGPELLQATEVLQRQLPFEPGTTQATGGPQ